MSNELKVFACSDCDLFAAENSEQASRLYEEMTGEKPIDGYPTALTDADLDAPTPEFDEDENRTGAMTSIRRMLAEHGDEPGWLAGSE